MPIATKKRRSRPSQSEFRRALIGRRNNVHEIVDRLVADKIGIDQFGDDFYRQLLDGHAQSWGLGRNRGGDLAEDLNDFLRGREKADEESEYLQRFLDDLQTERYRDAESGALKGDPIKLRTDLYVQKMRGTAGEAFVHTFEAEEELEWSLGTDESHCEDCPQMAALSPFTKETLFSYPGDGQTECLSRCLCHLVRLSDSITSFKPVYF